MNCRRQPFSFFRDHKKEFLSKGVEKINPQGLMEMHFSFMNFMTQQAQNKYLLHKSWRWQQCLSKWPLSPRTTTLTSQDETLSLLAPSLGHRVVLQWKATKSDSWTIPLLAHSAKGFIVLIKEELIENHQQAFAYRCSISPSFNLDQWFSNLSISKINYIQLLKTVHMYNCRDDPPPQ